MKTLSRDPRCVHSTPLLFSLTSPTPFSSFLDNAPTPLLPSPAALFPLFREHPPPLPPLPYVQQYTDQESDNVTKTRSSMQFCYWIRLLLDQVTCQMHMFASNCIWAKLSFASRSSLCQVSERIGLFEHNKLLSGPVTSFNIWLCTSFCVIDSHWSHT